MANHFPQSNQYKGCLPFPLKPICCRTYQRVKMVDRPNVKSVFYLLDPYYHACENAKYHKTIQASNKTLNQLPEPVPCQFNVYLRKFSFLSANLSRIRKVTEASDLRPAKIKKKPRLNNINTHLKNTTVILRQYYV